MTVIYFLSFVHIWDGQSTFKTHETSFWAIFLSDYKHFYALMSRRKIKICVHFLLKDNNEMTVTLSWDGEWRTFNKMLRCIELNQLNTFTVIHITFFSERTQPINVHINEAAEYDNKWLWHIPDEWLKLFGKSCIIKLYPVRHGFTFC